MNHVKHFVIKPAGKAAGYFAVICENKKMLYNDHWGKLEVVEQFQFIDNSTYKSIRETV